MVTTEQIKELTGRREGLRRHLAIEDKLIEFDEEQARTLAPDFWDRPEEAEKQLRKVAGIKSWIDDFRAIERLCDDLELMPDFVREGGASEEELDALYAETLAKIEALEMRNMLRGPEDRMGAIMDINSGAGGTESLDWASMLLRMYTRWGELNGYKVRIAERGGGNQIGYHRIRGGLRLRFPQKRERRTPARPPLAIQRQQQTADDLRVGLRIAGGGRHDRNQHQSRGHHLGYLS